MSATTAPVSRDILIVGAGLAGAAAATVLALAAQRRGAVAGRGGGRGRDMMGANQKTKKQMN